MSGSRPRRFFDLLCAHKWQIIGDQISTHGLNSRTRPLLQCEHCGELKVSRS